MYYQPPQTGQILKNLIPTEPVRIEEVQELGQMMSLRYTGVNSKREGSRIISMDDLARMEVVSHEGQFNFTGDPERFKLFAEAERIYSAYQYDPLFAVNCSIVDPLPHQVEAVYKYLLPLPKIRFLLADDTGAGKTIMTGLLIKELLMRSLIERILIITPGGLTKQWQEDELGLKFNLSFKLVNRAIFDSDPNVFSNSSRLITSIDFLRGEDVLNVVSDTRWDLIVVDEAHKLSAFDYGQKKYVSKRYQALEQLSAKCDHLLLLTATPHRGRRDTFKNLLQLLDEDIFSSDALVSDRVKELSRDGTNKFFIRRLKEDMKDWNGQDLFKKRHTKTTLYELTPDEKHLYDRVTEYLTRKREEARAESNIYVGLALMVMQRRLTSSIYAIMRTLRNRYSALSSLLHELSMNPGLWNQRARFDQAIDSVDEYDDLDDQYREQLENIQSDPRKFRLFTTAKNPGEIRQEMEQVKALKELAENLYNSSTEEQKYRKLMDLLRSEGIIDGREKLVIFTEHKDTLDYLEQKLRNNGYIIATIHGGKSVEERRTAQADFARDAQILLATDAAGEGINLQFCRLLINWDIPWNPNRLEQRMGRIHRYGQKEDVLVFNLVAQNTREGAVLRKLLEKLDLIREQMGDDRVYDVIQDLLENVSLEEVMRSTFEGLSTSYDEAIESRFTPDNVRQKIREQKEKIGHSRVDFSTARTLKESSDERRLQPIYIRMFFEHAFRALGGEYVQVQESVFRITSIPEPLRSRLRADYNIVADPDQMLLCFDKAVFLQNQLTGELSRAHYINPGNPLFDSLVKVIREQFREDMLRGSVLISAEDKNPFFAFFVRSRIMDNRPHKEEDNVADERILMIMQQDEQFSATSPAKFIDLKPPAVFARHIDPPPVTTREMVVQWTFQQVTQPQYQDARIRVETDLALRRRYLEEAFDNILFDLSAEINELQSRILFDDNARVMEKIHRKQDKITELQVRREERLQLLNFMGELSMKTPEVLGCAWVVPLSQVDYEQATGMRRDDEAEAVAMQAAMEFERAQGWRPEDVSGENLGYDIRSSSSEGLKRYIEVKGRSGEGDVILSENEMNRLAQLGDNAWLYIVIHCKSEPQLYRVVNPAANLVFNSRSKGIQYFLPMREWREKAIL